MLPRNFRRRTPQRFPCIVSLGFSLLLLCSAAQCAEPTPLEALFTQPSLFGSAPRQPAWSADGRRLAFSWAEAGTSRRYIWLVDASGENLRRLDKPTADSPAAREFVWRADRAALLTLQGEQLWQRDADSGASQMLHRVGAEAHHLALSPDGRQVSFLRDGDLWVFDLQSGSERALTTLGLPPLSEPPTGRYSRPEREIGPGIWGGLTYRWSPDGRRIAVHVVDRRQMRKVPFPNYLAPETDPNPVRRGYPGDPNEARHVGLIDLQSGELSLLALNDPAANQIIGFSWSVRGDLLIDTATDTNTTRRLYLLRSGQDGPATMLFWESPRETRIYTRFAAEWGPQGKDIIVLADREKHDGLYRLSAATDTPGSLERLDSGEYDVLGAPLVLADSGAVFFEATGGDPSQRQVFRRLPGATAAMQLTQAAGEHRAYPAPRGGAVAFIYSSDRSPPELYLLPAAGTAAQRVTHSPPEAFAEFSLPESRYLHAPGPDGELAIRLLLPADFDARQRYPVLFGPMYSNTVRNRWGPVYNRVQQLLTQRGYLVAQVDMRGSSGYGRDFREAFLKDFAGEDIADVEAAAAYLKSLDYVDGDRLGIWGSSYGGTLSVYTLLKRPGLFAAGVAAAAAVDPHFFGTDDVAIVRRPQDSPGIFERRAVDLAAALEDQLLLVHGLQDQVVPFKTVATLADALIREGKQFETAFLPGATHAWSREPAYNRYVFQRLIEFFDRHLKPAGTE